jgi:hypothetical protein
MALLIAMQPRVMLPRLLRVCTAGCILALFAAPFAVPAVNSNREHQIKAAALYNIIAFTDWPETAFASPDAPLVLAIVGQGPIASLLGEFIENETWHGRRIQIRRVNSVAEARGCHVLFLARSAQGSWRNVGGQVAAQPILSVSDEGNFAREGGIVQLAIDRNRLLLIVNLAAARRAGISISSKVLRLAQVLDDRAP